uniref:Auxin responsive protein n=1 Tax=Oryza punctata TaxID=4537 RepID=A0A0E0MPU0_ORYPU
MRQMIRRLSRVGDCSSPSSPPPFSPAPRRGGGSSGKRSSPAAAAHEGVPEGHVPVYVVGEEEGGEAAAERFVVRAELLGRPALAELLRRAAQEYGYDHHGPLRIPCRADVFRAALAAAGDEEDDSE